MKQTKMTTKERITDEALTLFSRHGYNGTSVKNIANAVGIKDSSIYKHFKTKREIVDAIVEQMQEKIKEMSAKTGLPSEENESAAAFYGTLSVKNLQVLSRKAFLFYLQDEFMSRFWRFATMEQYQDPAIYNIFRDLFFDQSIIYQKTLFGEMLRQKAFDHGNPEIMALHFYAPIFFLLCKYTERNGQVEEALEILDRHISEFCRIYQN